MDTQPSTSSSKLIVTQIIAKLQTGIRQSIIEVLQTTDDNLIDDVQKSIETIEQHDPLENVESTLKRKVLEQENHLYLIIIWYIYQKQTITLVLKMIMKCFPKL